MLTKDESSVKPAQLLGDFLRLSPEDQRGFIKRMYELIDILKAVETDSKSSQELKKDLSFNSIQELNEALAMIDPSLTAYPYLEGDAIWIEASDEVLITIDSPNAFTQGEYYFDVGCPCNGDAGKALVLSKVLVIVSKLVNQFNSYGIESLSLKEANDDN